MKSPHVPDLKIAMLMDQSLGRDLFSKLTGGNVHLPAMAIIYRAFIICQDLCGIYVHLLKSQTALESRYELPQFQGLRDPL